MQSRRGIRTRLPSMEQDLMGEFDMTPQQLMPRLTEAEKLKRVGTETGISTVVANRITQARLQLALSELADMNVSNVNIWLSEVAKNHPAEAIRLFLELLEFRMPRMKAAQIVANLTPTPDGQRKLEHMSIEELGRVVAEG